MKVMKLKKNITHRDVRNLTSFSREHFSYDAKDALTLRLDLAYLVKCLQRIRKHQNDTNEPLDFERGSTNREIIVIDDNDDEESGDVGGVPIFMSQTANKKAIKTKTKTKLATRSKMSIASLRKEGREIADEKKAMEKEKIANFHGKMNRGTRKGVGEAIAKAGNPLPRMKGEAAPSLKAYKDRPFRRALYKCVTSLGSFQDMLPFVSKHANRTMKQMSTVGLIYDPISEYPDAEGERFAQYREEPLRFAVCPSPEYLDKLIADLNNFRDKWTIVSDAAEIDRLIVGEERQNLVDFISKKKTSGVGVQDKVENKDALANTNRLLTSPAPKGGSKMVDVEINLDEI